VQRSCPKARFRRAACGGGALAEIPGAIAPGTGHAQIHATHPIRISVSVRLFVFPLFMPTTVILASGDFPTRPALLAELQSAANVVCCDSAALALMASGVREPEVVVGDLDSLPEEFIAHFHGELVHESEQETNDLSKAFRYCLAHGWTDRIIILGGTGKREDHTLGNIALLLDFAEKVPSIELWTDFGYFEAMTHSGTRACTPGEQLSIISPDCRMPISAKGLVYPLDKLVLPRWWCGTLNETTGTQFALEFSGSPVLLYHPWAECGVKHPACAHHLPWRKVHFCGCGGVGMAALANILLDDGCQVSGSDAADSALLRQLASRGADVHIGHASANIPEDTELLVYSSAVGSENPERQYAETHDIPQCRRGVFLARVSRYFKRVIAVAGSHGKTTVSAMIAHILRSNGINAGYMVGGRVNGWAQSGCAGAWDILVTEVDESDRTQEMMLPELAVILNVDDDHSWAIGGSAVLEQSFAALAEHALHTLTWNEAELHRILADVPSVQYLAPECTSAVPLLPQPGEHNRRNAAIAVQAAYTCGVTQDDAMRAVASFPGVQRRLTLRYQNSDATQLLYEDYAHHPTELSASLVALHEAHPGFRFVVYFQPHRPERLLRYGTRFAQILASQCDESIIVTPFLAWEQNAPEADPRGLVAAINAHSPNTPARLVANDPVALAEEIRGKFACCSAPLLIAVIGAGDISKVLEAYINAASR
jgi:UDP-N-acetylmuramate--alanine ligase